MIATAQTLQPELPLVIPFPTLHKPSQDLSFAPGAKITLRDYWTRCVLPDLNQMVSEGEMSRRSITEDRHALNAWERHTANPDIREVTPAILEQFKSSELERQLSPATINKHWRELSAMFSHAVYEELIPRKPQIGHRRRSRLLREPPKRQREALTEAEVERLWNQTNRATYPARSQFPAPQLWRVWIVLCHTYGPRPIDLKKLRWDDVRWNDRLLQFEATKTGKLQGLPLTDTVIAYLRSIKGHSELVFPGFRSTGCKLSSGKWKRGYYATWRSEIADGLAPEIHFKNFRETMVTRYNRLEKDLGAWVAGHFIPGVTAQNYDLPTEAIRKAIEAAPVPLCFLETI